MLQKTYVYGEIEAKTRPIPFSGLLDLELFSISAEQKTIRDYQNCVQNRQLKQPPDLKKRLPS